MTTTTTARPTTRMMPLILLMIAIVAPALVATAFYVFGWRPGGSSSHGELIVPPQTLPELALTADDGQAVGPDSLHGKWSLLYLMPDECADECHAVLLSLRMVHVAQGREYKRVQRVLVGNVANRDAETPEAQVELMKDCLRLTADKPSLAALRETLSRSGGSPGEVYLVDPLGNLIMRYRSDSDPKGMRKDIAHLLKHSWVG